MPWLTRTPVVAGFVASVVRVPLRWTVLPELVVAAAVPGRTSRRPASRTGARRVMRIFM
jgi:hypothetical protein